MYTYIQYSVQDIANYLHLGILSASLFQGGLEYSYTQRQMECLGWARTL